MHALKIVKKKIYCINNTNDYREKSLGSIVEMVKNSKFSSTILSIVQWGRR